MNTIRIHRKRKHINTLEKYHIFNISDANLQMNGTNTDTHTVIFQALQVTDLILGVYILLRV
jgi:hypothetical protein